jgi:hypothetical protein
LFRLNSAVERDPAIDGWMKKSMQVNWEPSRRSGLR